MTILKIDSSITGENSVSRMLTRSITDQLAAANPGATVIERDLVAAPLAHLTRARCGHRRARRIPGRRHDRDRRADVQFQRAIQLKAWIDRIAVAGKTFRYGAQRPGRAGRRQARDRRRVARRLLRSRQQLRACRGLSEADVQLHRHRAASSFVPTASRSGPEQRNGRRGRAVGA